MKKVTIIGAGNVGTNTAAAIFRSCSCEIVLIDAKEGWAEGRAMDIRQSANLTETHSLLRGTSSYDGMVNSDFIVITAGSPRKAGMSRIDLLETNKRIMSGIGAEIGDVSPNAVILMVTNPVDHLTHFLKREYPDLNIFGFGCSLDSVRYRFFIGQKLNINPYHINGLMVGTHNPDMIPFIEGTSIGGVPVTEFLTQKELEEIRVETLNAGTEIVKMLKATGSSYTAGEIIGKIARAVLDDMPDVFSVDIPLNGEMGISDVTLSVPAVVNSHGVSKILPIPRGSNTYIRIHKLAEIVKKTM